MERVKLNETPVRTSRNFNINHIKLENVIIPEKVEPFSNVEILKEGSDIEIDNRTNLCELVYGLGDFFTQQVKEQANQKLKVSINSKTEQETQIKFGFDNENRTLIDQIEVIAKEDTKATVIIKYESDQEVEGFHNGIIKVQAQKGAQLDVIIINLTNTVTNHFISIENDFEEQSKVRYTMVDFGGKHSITNYYSNLVGKGSENILNTIYLGKNQQLFDLNYIGELRGEKSKIDIEVQGALKDTAKKHFKGTIDFKKGAKKARGNENETCMLLSDTAKSLALPMLLCSEEEVEGNHSSSCGKIGEKELFYIMSRGFELKEAMKLMVRAKFTKIIENIKNTEIQKEILEEIDKRLD